MKRRPFKITFSARSRLWTIWRQSPSGGWAYPIAINRSLEAACRQVEVHPLWGLKAVSRETK